MIECLIILIIQFLENGDACWGSSSTPDAIDPDIIDKAENDAILSKELYPNYLKKAPWINGPAGEALWPGKLCKKGAGTRQSPIDIPTSKAVRDFEKEFIKYGPLKFRNYDIPMHAIAFNNGNTLQFISMASNASEPTVTGGPLDNIYRLEQIHYHWPSEHSINGHKFPMEIHFVHIRREMDVEEALKEKDGLAILAVFWNLILGWQQQVMRPEDVPYFLNLRIPGTKLSGVELNAAALIRTNHNAYFTYSGSLSSPMCDEAVTWIIFETPLMVPENLYRAFGFLGVQRNNYRSLQPLKEHKIYRTTYRAIMTPLLADTFSDIGRLMTDAIKNFSVKAYDWTGRIAKAAEYAVYSYKNKEKKNADQFRRVVTDNEGSEDVDDENLSNKELTNEEIDNEKTWNKETKNEENYIPVNVETGREEIGYKRPATVMTDYVDINSDRSEKVSTKNGWSRNMKFDNVDSDNKQYMDFDNLLQVKNN